MHNFPKSKYLDKGLYSVSLDLLSSSQSQTHVDIFLKSLFDTVPEGSVLLGSITWEYRSPKLWADKINDLAKLYRLILILDDAYQQSCLDQINVEQIIYINFFLLRSYYEIEIAKQSQYNKVWNSNTNKFLFLTGKPEKIHRIGLLYKFWKNNLLNSCIWSMFMPQNKVEACRDIINQPDCDQFFQQIAIENYSPDHIQPQLSGESIHYGGFPYDSNLYRQTSFRVISETSVDAEVPWITEKTWTTILNYSPFIVIAETNFLAKLKRFGFETFEKYLPISNYDSIKDVGLRLQAVLENTKQWLVEINQQEEHIKCDVDKNFKLAQNLIRCDLVKITDLANQVSCPEHKRNLIIQLWDNIVDTWPDFYYNIKDPTWPDCYNEDDFCKLPIHIQKECVEIFKYTPKHSILSKGN